MGISENLDFNLDILTDGENKDPSLSDLYDIPVFTNKIDDRSNEEIENNKQDNENLKQKVFYINRNERFQLKDIRSEVFTTTALSREYSDEEEPTTLSSVYLIGINFSIFFILSLLTFYGLKKRKERLKAVEEVNYFD